MSWGYKIYKREIYVLFFFALFHKPNETAQKIVKHIVIQGFLLLIIRNDLPEKLIAALRLLFYFQISEILQIIRMITLFVPKIFAKF